MIPERASLRLRLFVMLLAAALAPLAPLSIVVLLQVRDALYGRTVADARQRLSTLRDRCGSGRCSDEAIALAGARRVSVPCPAPTRRVGEQVILCENLEGGAVEVQHDLRPVREQLSALDRRLLVALGIFLLLLLGAGVVLLERGVARRLERIDAALTLIGAEQHEPSLVPEGGDAFGRVGAAVNRLAQRLREERGRTRAQIEALEAANQKLRQAREDLARSERLASVGRLAAGVAHEVGNPVSAVIGYAALMKERFARDGEVSDYARRIEREGARIDRILRDLLDLARPPAALSGIDIRRALDVAREAVAPQHASVALECELPKDLPPVRADEHYLAQVFVNLFANAAKAGASRVRVVARREDAAVLVDVADDGSGIPAEVLPRLFEPFFTTAAPGRGTGLGLAVCHATMERFGGAISARNGEARGAVFELRFPIADARPGA